MKEKGRRKKNREGKEREREREEKRTERSFSHCISVETVIDEGWASKLVE